MNLMPTVECFWILFFLGQNKIDYWVRRMRNGRRIRWKGRGMRSNLRVRR